MNPRAPHQAGALRRGADSTEVFDIARLQPERQARDRPGVPRAATTTTRTTTTSSRSCSGPTRPFDGEARGLPRAIVQVYGPDMLRYKGVLNMKGTDRKVVFQGVHKLMGGDLGKPWAQDEKKQQDGVHRHRAAEGHLPRRPRAVLACDAAGAYGYRRAATAAGGGSSSRRRLTASRAPWTQRDDPSEVILNRCPPIMNGLEGPSDNGEDRSFTNGPSTKGRMRVLQSEPPNGQQHAYWF